MAGRTMVVVIGGINLDIHLTSTSGIMAPGTSNPARSAVSSGGVACNIARTLAHRGVEVELLGMVGTDALSALVVRDLEDAGVGLAHLVRDPERCVGLYAALLNHDGTLAMAASDMDAIDHLSPDHLTAVADVIQSADALVLDANLTHETTEAALALADGRTPVYLDPVSAAKARRVAACQGTVRIATPSVSEAEALVSGPLGAEWLVVTHGAAGCEILREGTRVAWLPAREVVAVDETGAGDALLAGIVEYLRGVSAEPDLVTVREAVSHGMRLAEDVVQNHHSIWRGTSHE